MQDDEEKQTYKLIDELMKRKDPALVGIRKILRSKTDALSSSMSFTAHTPEVFNIETKEKSRGNETIFKDKELEQLEYGKTMLELEENIKRKESEIETVRQKSFESGKAEGIEEQQKKIKAIIGEIEEKMKTEVQKRLAEQINQELNDREKYFKSLEEDIYQTITALVKKILDAEIQTNKTLIINAIKKSLSHISQRGGITIRVSNNDFDYVNSQISLFNRHRDGTYTINIVQDEHIKTGGCLIETDSTIVDAQIEMRTEKTLDLIEQIWNETKNEGENIPQKSADEDSQNEEIKTETLGKETQSEEIPADTLGNDTQSEEILADTLGNDTQSEEIPADTLGNDSENIDVSQEFIADEFKSEEKTEPKNEAEEI